MKILDFKVDENANKAIISVEIKKGRHVFNRAFGFAAEDINSFEMESFKKRIYQHALTLIENAEYKEAAMRRIGDFVNVKIMLD